MPLSTILAQYSALLPIIVFFLYFKKIKDWHLWVIFFYCVVSFSNDSVLIYRVKHDLDLKPFLYAFTIIEYLIFAVFLFSIIQSKVVKRVLLALSVLFTLFCLYAITWEVLKKFDSVQSCLSAILLISFCIIYLFEQINKPDITFIYASYPFWIVAGILIYLATTLFLYGFAASLPTDAVKDYWIINHVCNVLKNILFSVAVLVYVKTPQTPENPKPNGYDYQPYLN